MPFRPTSQEPVMNKPSCMLLALIVFSLAHSSVEAQTIARSDQPKPETSAPSSKTDSDSSRADIQELRAKVDQLLMIVERQQRAMSEMEKRLNSVETGPSKAVPAPSSFKLDETAGATSADASAAKRSAPAASSPASGDQAPPLDARVQKVEEQVLKLGPIRFSGDFRLRYDAILRRASEAP